MHVQRFAPFVLLFSIPIFAVAQQPERSYSRLNTFSSFFEYSNDSSHIILGSAINRKIGSIGFQYQRRVVHRRPLDLFYEAEIRPGMIESDPMQQEVDIQTLPVPQTGGFNLGAVLRCTTQTYSYSHINDTPTGPILYAGTVIETCPRRTVIEQGFAPAGLRLNLLPHHRLQLTFSSTGGYIFSTQEVPIPDAGSFNFTFDFGGGLEYFLSGTRSVRLEYQVQHYSNKGTADQNPGVDSGFLKLTYAFGR
jgi:opacity protein-like surface antigen